MIEFIISWFKCAKLILIGIYFAKSRYFVHWSPSQTSTQLQTNIEQHFMKGRIAYSDILFRV